VGGFHGRLPHKLLVGKTEVKRLLERPKRRWVYNIKMVLGEIEWGGVDCIYVAPSSIKCCEARAASRDGLGSRQLFPVVDNEHRTSMCCRTFLMQSHSFSRNPDKKAV
jgi:hypothetical protein